MKRTPEEINKAIESVEEKHVRDLAQCLQRLCGEASGKDFVKQEGESKERPSSRAVELLATAYDWLQFGN